MTALIKVQCCAGHGHSQPLHAYVGSSSPLCRGNLRLREPTDPPATSLSCPGLPALPKSVSPTPAAPLVATSRCIGPSPLSTAFLKAFSRRDTAAGSSKRTEGFSKMEETIENLTQWWECGYICGAQQAGITGVVLLTIFLNKNSFIKTKIFCNEVLHFYHNHHYHFPQLESFHVMKTNIIDF